MTVMTREELCDEIGSVMGGFEAGFGFEFDCEMVRFSSSSRYYGYLGVIETEYGVRLG